MKMKAAEVTAESWETLGFMGAMFGGLLGFFFLIGVVVWLATRGEL